jgi:hypothetical protein
MHLQLKKTQEEAVVANFKYLYQLLLAMAELFCRYNLFPVAMLTGQPGSAN